jgi:beta-N-acetylhexosaminidase
MRALRLILGWMLVMIMVGCGAASGSPAPAVTSPAPTTASSSPASATPTPSSPTTASSPTRSPSPAPDPLSCGDLVDAMSLREQVGQLMMVGVNSGGLGAAEGRTLARTRAGSVILLGNSTLGAGPTRRVVRDVRAATRRPEGVKTMLAVDQEGGQVQRLKGEGFDTIPSAQSQAEQSGAKLTANAARWGRQLAAVGIDANLAPVADVVPADLGPGNAPIGLLRRGYGSSPRTVAAKTTAFVTGMDRSGIATAVKHFPGLGRVRGNTDFVRRVVDDQTTRRDPGLAGFAATIDAGVDMVMVASAYYTKIDADHRAAFSTAVIGSMLRRELKFDRVVISDDLAAAAMVDLAPGTRALRFVRAGGDLLIVGDPSQADAMADTLQQAARDDPGVARRVAESATRVVNLKADRGLADCAR